jgi:hypothetical protein
MDDIKTYSRLPIPKDSAWERNTFWRKLPSWLKEFLTGCNNLIKWAPTIWKQRDWDDAFIFDVLQKKIEFQRKELVSANRHMNIDRDNRDMTLALNLLERVREEHYQLECMDYWNDDISFEDVPNKPDSKSFKIITTGERFDEYLKKYSSSVRVVIEKRGVIEDKKTLCLEVSYYNHNKANKLLFRVLEERLPYWWD